MLIVVTGGAGFIGSALIRQLLSETDTAVVNVDKLTYAGHLSTLSEIEGNERYHFEQLDICDTSGIKALIKKYQPDAIMHLAAESHVDRSIDTPSEFIQTNIVGTYNLLQLALGYWQGLSGSKQQQFRFHHISTDEVYGSLGGSLGDSGIFTEQSPYQPNSPYAASKASSDHLVRAWYHTYGLPVVMSNCTNNFGPYQFPEKLIPLVIRHAIQGKPLPVYGTGENIRDWLYVDDHVRALRLVLEKGRLGESYNIGTRNEKTNLQLVHAICGCLDELLPESKHRPHAKLIEFVQDRPGHDLRYALDPTKIEQELGWRPDSSFDESLHGTVKWYIEHQEWCDSVTRDTDYGERLGLIKPGQ